VRASGRLDAKLEAAVQRGAIQPKTEVSANLRQASISARDARFVGDAALSLGVPKRTDTLEFRFSSAEIRGTERDRVRGPELSGLAASIALAPRKLSQSLDLVAASASLRAGEVPDLGWFEPWLERKSSRARLGGSARLAFQIDRGRDRAVHGAFSATARGASVRSSSFELESDAALETVLARSANDAVFRGTADVSLDDWVLATSAGRSEPIAAQLRSRDLRIDSSAATVEAHVSVEARRVEGFLPLVVGFGPLRSIISGALGLSDLSATVKLELAPRARRLDLVGAKSGGLRARGHAESIAGAPWNGRFLLSTRIANIGVRIDAGDTSVDPFVSDDWLRASPSAVKAPSIPRPRAATRWTLSGDRGPRASPRAAENRRPGHVPRHPSAHAR
jgi:hypothetical protein